MKKQFLLLTVLLFLLGACAPKPAEHSFIKVNADGHKGGETMRVKVRSV